MADMQDTEQEFLLVGNKTFNDRPFCRLLRWVLFCAQAVTHYNDPKKLAEVSTGLGEAMVGIDCRTSNFYSYAARSE